MPDGFHLSLSLGRALWDDLLRAALPVRLQEGEFDVVANARAAVRQLGVRERVAGLLEDRRPPRLLVRAGDRARAVWDRRKPGLKRRIRETVRVEGTWRLELDDAGTKFRYGKQQVGADAWLKGTAEGTIFLLRSNIELPFVLEKRVGASITLGDIRYERETQAVTGDLRDIGVNIGEHPAFQLLSRLAERLLEDQLPRANPVPILRREQVEELVGGMGGALKMKMGVEHLELIVDEDDLTLRVRFGFSHLQLEER